MKISETQKSGEQRGKLHSLVGQKTLLSEETFRSEPTLACEDDMVRVTIEMKRTCWWGWKRQMFKMPNDHREAEETNEGDKMEKTPTPTKRAIALAKKRAVSDSLNELVLCPKCQRGDIWQEAINRAEYVYSCDDLVRGQEVIDYILAEVSVMLEQAEND